ncbi:hypothetical protein HZA57_09500 [Candidatus Poribacteria bacterium]|nr:hypothetical protein [Candidatus Poribacteria bacterium]
MPEFVRLHTGKTLNPPAPHRVTSCAIRHSSPANVHGTGPRIGWTIWALLILNLLAGAFPAAAQDLVINASAGFGGYYRPGRWCPVTVSIQNQPKSGKPGDRSLDFHGILTVESSSLSGRAEKYEFTRDVEVPAFSTQQFVLYAKFSDNPSPSPLLSVRWKNGRRVTDIPLDIQPLKKGQVLMVTVSDQIGRLHFPIPRLGALNSITNATMPARNFPDHWAGYDSIDILAFPKWPEGRLLPRHAEAIRDWVGMGGTLVFLGGGNSSGYGVEEAASLLPVETSTSSPHGVAAAGFSRLSDDVNLAETKGVLISNAVPKPGTEVLMEAVPGTPLLVREQHGLGQIVFLGVDLETTSMELRTLLYPYWMAVIPLRNMVDWEWELPNLTERLRTVTGSAARPPSVIIIILICILYTAIVGPVNFHVLGRRNMVQWAWLSVPAIVLVFSGLIYSIGSITKGGKAIARELTVFRGHQGQSVFEERGVLSMFVPRADTYRAIPGEPKITASDFDRWHERERVAEGESAYTTVPVVSGQSLLGFGPTVPRIHHDGKEVFVSQWPLRTFDTAQYELRGPRELGGGIEADVSLMDARDGLTFGGTIENKTGFSFYECGLFLGGRGAVMGELADGATLELDPGTLTWSGGTAGSAYPRRWTHWRSALETMAPSEAGDSDQAINRGNASTFLSGMFEPEVSGPLLPPLAGKLLFVGLAESPDLTADIDLERDFGTRSIVVMVELNPRVPKGRFTLPGSMVQVRLQEYESGLTFRINKPGAGDHEEELEMLNSSGLFSVELPFHSPDLQGIEILPYIDSIVDGQSQIFRAGVYNDQRGEFIPADQQRAVRDANGSVLTPCNGRAWVFLDSQAPQTEERTGSDPTYIQSMKFTVTGVQD